MKKWPLFPPTNLVMSIITATVASTNSVSQKLVYSMAQNTATTVTMEEKI